METPIIKAISELDSFAWSDSCDKENVIAILEDLVEKEKQVIIEAHIDGGYIYSDYTRDAHLEKGLKYYNLVFKK